MRVPTSGFSHTLISQLQKFGTKQSQLQVQVASGQRITNLSDDPSAASRVMKAGQEKLQIQQYDQNYGRALNISEASFAAVSEIKKVSDRAGELVILGQGVLGPDAKNAYAVETDQMLDTVTQLINSKNGSEYLFGGTKTDVPPFLINKDPLTGEITSVTYQGAAAGISIQTSEGTTSSPYTDGTENQQLATFVNNLIQMRDALKTNNQAALLATQTALQSSEDDLLATISGIGAEQTRLESDHALNQARFTGLNNLASQDLDVDVAQTMVALTQAQTSYQAALQSGAKLLQLSLMDYIN